MKSIEHNDFKFYTPPGVVEIVKNFCLKNSIFKSPENDFWKYLYIVSHVTSNSWRQKTNDDSCRINIQTLSKLLGTKNGQTSRMIKNLVELGIIKKIDGYEVGIKSTGYALVYKGLVYESTIALPQYTTIPSKIINRHNKSLSEPGNDLKIYKKFLRNITVDIPSDYFKSPEYSISVFNQFSSSGTRQPVFSQENVTYHQPIDTRSYSSTPSLSHNIPLMMGKLSYNSQPEDDTADLTNIYFTSEKVHSHMISITAIQNGEWFVYRPDKESRVHTNLTNLKREFRHFLKYDGNHLMELDIRNSQPLIATTLIKKYWQRETGSIPEDVIQYQKACEAGEFYEYFMKLNNVSHEDRGDFKVKIFGEVFFSKVSKRKTRLKEQFINKYPSAYEAISAIGRSGIYNL